MIGDCQIEKSYKKLPILTSITFMGIIKHEWTAQHKAKAQQHFDSNKHRRNLSSSGYKYFVKKDFVESMPPLNGEYKGASFWSSTERDSSFAWGGYFSSGDDGWSNKTVQDYALCVR